MCHHSYEQQACAVTHVFFTKALHQGHLLDAVLHYMLFTTLLSPVAARPEPEFIVRVELGEHNTKERIINVSAIVLRDAANQLSLQINITRVNPNPNKELTLVESCSDRSSGDQETFWGMSGVEVSRTYPIESNGQCEHRYFFFGAILPRTNIDGINHDSAAEEYMVQAIHPTLGSTLNITIALFILVCASLYLSFVGIQCNMQCSKFIVLKMGLGGTNEGMLNSQNTLMFQPGHVSDSYKPVGLEQVNEPH